MPKKALAALDRRRSPPRPTGAVPILGHVEKRAWGGRLAWSTAIFSLATGLSRILGLIREIVAAYFFGTRGAINAFTVAFQIPNLIRAIVADAALVLRIRPRLHGAAREGRT